MPHAATTRSGTDGMPSHDWDLLFDAVAVKLRHCVRDLPALALRATVEDCARSLELLRAALGQQRGYLRHVEAQLCDTSAALATARAELGDARAGELHAQHLSQHDSLTELPNRSQFTRRLDDALGAGPVPPSALAVLCLLPGRLQAHQ